MMGSDEQNPVSESGTTTAAVDSTPETATAPAVETTTDRAALEAKVEAGLNVLQRLGDPDSEPVEDAKPSETEEEKPDDSTDTGTETVEESPEAPDQQPAPKAGPTVPDAYRRSLKAYDWSDEEINAAAKTDPAAFLVMAQRIHANRNAELARWAEMGRAQRQQPQGQPAQQGPSPAQPRQMGGMIPPVDIEAMIEKHGNEDLVRDLAGPVNEAISRLNAVMPDLMTGVNAIQQSRTQTLAQQVDQFFGRPELAPFKAVYGSDSSKLEPGNIEARNKVLEMADALIAGAGSQGRSLSVEEALLMAHDATSGAHKTEAIRAGIKKEVKMRNAALTLRPGKASTAKANNGPPRSKDELEARTRGRLAAVFGNG